MDPSRFRAAPLLLAFALPVACKTTVPPANPAEPAPAEVAPAEEANTPDPPRAHHWGGGVALPNGQDLPFFVAIEPSDESPTSYKGRISIPIQGLFDAELTDVRYGDGKVAFTFAAAGASWTGEVDEDDTIECELSQGGAKLPCEMDALDEAAYAEQTKPKRPQEPKPPFPYEVREVEYDNPDGTHLAGTLTVPEGAGPHPVALMITGSGAQDRDESLLGHRPFWVIADHLSRNGIAVLRVDDRGVGKSTGSVQDSTTADFAGDVLAGVEFLKQQKGINPKKIGLIGHSEGAVVGPLAASKSKDIAFVVMLAGTGVPGDEIIIHQGQLIARAGGMDSASLEQDRKDSKEVFRILREVKDIEAAKQQITEFLRKALAARDPAKLARFGITNPDDYIKGMLKQVSTPWFRFFVTYDPRDALRSLKVPVLVLNGSLDLQVDPAQNLPEIRKALKKARNRDVTIEERQGLNHLFQEAQTGHPSEYAAIEQTIQPAVLDTITAWISARALGKKGKGAAKKR